MARYLLLPLVLLVSLCLAGPLSAQSDEFGKWISLFNGKDTTGWVNAKPDEGNHKGPNRWTVEDGALTNGNDGQNDVCTEAEFENYELELEYRVPVREKRDGNSGVYLRGWVEVQVFDSHGREKPQAHDAGAIYGGFVPLKNTSKPAGEWNRYRIVHLGKRVTVYHNGALVQDNVLVPANTPGSMTLRPRTKEKLDGIRGPIMFQGDHTKVWYRNIRIRPMVTAADGWRPLWNGRDLSEFTARGDKRAAGGLAWKIEDGAFTNAESGGKGHDIWTNEAFGNFLVHYEYRSDPKVEGGNSGFYLRDQWEIQILRETTKDPHSDGSLYSIKAPDAVVRNGPTEWNQMDVKVDGMKIWVWQNGKLLHDGATLKTRTDNHGVKTEAWSKGPFKLQGDHGKVWFANLFIKPLPDTGEQRASL